MSLHYLLDGYNIVHQAPALAQGSLEERRAALVRWLNIARPQGSARNRVTVVFDGHPDHYGGMAGGDVKVVFSQGQDADTCIKTAVEISRTPKDLVVVSDDKSIKLYARALGAKVLGVKEFAADLFARPSRKTAGKTQARAAESKYVSLTQAQKINKEMEKLWLK